MATMERFNAALKKGAIPLETGATVPMTAQMKYDYLAAVHTMDQLLNLTDDMEKTSKNRAAMREKFFKSCRITLKKLVDENATFDSIKQIDSAIKALKDCRDEVAKIDYAEQESKRLYKFVEDGVSAGR